MIINTKQYRFIASLAIVWTGLIFATATFAQANDDDKPIVPAPELSDAEKQTSGMTQEKMADIARELAGEIQGPPNNFTFSHNGVPITVVSDAKANRMRILAPIIGIEQLTEEHYLKTMIANFHLALDARYAIGGSMLYSTFIHPMQELTKTQLLSAIRQVSTLRSTFGSTYTSGELSFGLQAPDEKLSI